MCSGFPFPRLTPSSLLSCGSIFWWGLLCCGRRDRHAQPQGSRASFGVWNNLLLVLDGGCRYGYGLSVVRWADNYHLFLLGMLSLIAATIALTAVRQCWRNGSGCILPEWVCPTF